MQDGDIINIDVTVDLNVSLIKIDWKSTLIIAIKCFSLVRDIMVILQRRFCVEMLMTKPRSW